MQRRKRGRGGGDKERGGKGARKRWSVVTREGLSERSEGASARTRGWKSAKSEREGGRDLGSEAERERGKERMRENEQEEGKESGEK
eukprot:498673-Pleurochrysis_carterae.AAC.2